MQHLKCPAACCSLTSFCCLQQAAVLREQTGLSVRAYVGDMNVDFWSVSSSMLICIIAAAAVTAMECS